MTNTMYEKLDETISNICDYINADIKRVNEQNTFILEETVELVKALAELVSAKAV